MTSNEDFESNVQWLGLCETCNDLSFVTTSEVSNKDQCQNCFDVVEVLS